jgi:predicted N-acetyltransferase YhbS
MGESTTDEELTAFLRDLPFLRAAKAADRIEALTEARDTMGHLWAKEAAAKQVALGRIEALTAELAKAVEALLLARVHVANNEQGWSVGRASARYDLNIINATLAEIEGEKT